MTIETEYPHTHVIKDGDTILSECIHYCRIFATEYAESEAKSRLPILMPQSEYNEVWNFAWKSAWEYITEGLTASQLYPNPTGGK